MIKALLELMESSKSYTVSDLESLLGKDTAQIKSYLDFLVDKNYISKIEVNNDGSSCSSCSKGCSSYGSGNSIVYYELNI